MDATAGGGQGGFARQVRDALAHVYDPVYLQTQPLARGLGAPPGEAAGRGRATRPAEPAPRLLDAIARLRPEGKAGEVPGGGGALPAAGAALREALGPPAVQEQLGVEKSQYYREHARALAALVSLLARRAAPAAEPPRPW